jgi:hypothetical protein
MQNHPHRSVFKRGAVSALFLLTAGFVGGCLDRPIEPLEPRSTSTFIDRLANSQVDKIDLLLVIDDSGSMADKQQVLAQAVPDLVKRLVTPLCVDKEDNAVDPQPQPGEECPGGSTPEFEPILDIHIGIISSSLGALGVCDEPGDPRNDGGHLLDRDMNGDTVPTYDGKHFLAWDPAGKLDPPGESVLENGAQGLIPALREMVTGVGQSGCGYEAQLESWYRFLADPSPYAKLGVPTDGPNKHRIVREGIDQELLAQRAAFLRPDSLLAVILLTDENDCSLKEDAEAWKMLHGGLRQECESDIDDPCCTTCDVQGQGCPEDPTCRAWNAPEDHINLRCHDQVKKYGADFLQPLERYVNALKEARIADHQGNLVPNPIFSDLDAGDGRAVTRDASLVFFAGIVGVPWQNIARDRGDLTRGFKNAEELQEPLPGGFTTWDLILGDPAAGVLPKDPLMIESIDPRVGVNPLTGESTAPPSSSNGAHPVNGHERTIADRDDLQYACIFSIAERDCDANPYHCDCRRGEEGEVESQDNPLCEPNPADGGDRTLQVSAKAYPGLRELGVLKGAKEQGIVASVCPKHLDLGENGDAPADYGYRPAISAIIDRLKVQFRPACLPRRLTPDDEGQVACLIVEARNTQGEACACDPSLARQPVAPKHQPAVTEILEDVYAAQAGWNCFCEVPQLRGEPLDACLTDPGKAPQVNGAPVDGWCYVDEHTSPEGAAEIVQRCANTEKRILRFAGKGAAQTGGTLFITCSGE